MSERIYEDGAPVYFYTWIDRVPGVVLDAVQNEQGDWIYRVDLLGNTIANNVPESKMCKRTIVEPPKYKKNEIVKFKNKEEELIGRVKIVDAYGTFEQTEEPSYDILVPGNPGCLWKHVRESQVLGNAEEEMHQKVIREFQEKKGKATVNMTNWQLYVSNGAYSLSGTADAHPMLGKGTYVSQTSSLVDYTYEDEVLTYETRNTIYVCPLKYMTLNPYTSVVPTYKEELSHRADESDCILDRIIAASAKLALENVQENGPSFFEKEYPYDFEHMDFSGDAFLNRIKALQKTGQEELVHMEEEENQRLIENAKKYEDCLYLEMSNPTQGCKAAYHFGEHTGVIRPSIHSGMFQDSILYMKYKENEDDISFDFRYFPKQGGFIMESYHWSDNIKYVVLKNDDDVTLEFNHITLMPLETMVFTEDSGSEGLFSPDCHNGKSLLNTIKSEEEE